VVRLALLMASRREGEEEWMKVMASTYRDHVILCGLGRLGIRVLEQLVASGTPVVALEKSKSNAFLSDAKGMDVPVLVRNMTEDQALIDAGVAHATAIIICTNDDTANLEVALDARRMNPRLRVVMRLFEQQLARKISDALDVDVAFSSSSLAAPLVAAMASGARGPSSLAGTAVAGLRLVSGEVTVAEGSPLCGRRLGDVETEFRAKVLARTPAGSSDVHPLPAGGEVVEAGDVLVVQTVATQLPTLKAAAGNSPSPSGRGSG
jgi:Trk K+ transport system NAD-binding subunit